MRGNPWAFDPTSPLGFSACGLVPGSGVRDSVPAVLAPGEMVLSRAATAAIGARALATANRYANGGLVGGPTYLSDGGTAGGAAGGEFGLSQEAMGSLTTFREAASTLAGPLREFTAPSTALTEGLRSFVGVAPDLTQALKGFPSKVSLDGRQTVEVVVTGAEVMTRLTPVIQKMVEEKTAAMLQSFIKDRLPELN